MHPSPTKDKTKQYVDLQAGERLVLDHGRTVITLEQKTGRRARLKIETEPANPVARDHEPANP